MKKYLFNLNKRRKYGDSYKLRWQCERRHDTACAVYVTTDDNGVVIKQPTVSRNHAISVGRAERKGKERKSIYIAPF